LHKESKDNQNLFHKSQDKSKEVKCKNLKIIAVTQETISQTSLMEIEKVMATIK
jgi:hypothetical protein